jgi:D-alanyl-D-alanine carboxypeptidase (penicillin-binding protein 5/6)
MDDSRFFTMNQLWQSLVITFVIGGLLVGGVAYGTGKIGHPETPATATTTVAAATTSQPAAAAAAVTQPNPFDAVHINGQAAIVVDLTTGQTLYAQNADQPLPLASLTKLVTLYGAEHALSPRSNVLITPESLLPDGDYGLVAGEIFAYEDLARFTLAASVNDGAEAIAEAAAAAKGVDVPAFMAQSIQDAGLTQTRVENSTGLDLDITHASAFGSARDVAKLAGEFLTAAPNVAQATTLASVTARDSNGTTHTLANTNPYAPSTPGLRLSKTGYTDIAGGNLAIVFDAGINHPVAIVVLGSTKDGRFTDVTALRRATLASFQLTP